MRRASPECLLLTVAQFNRLVPAGSAVRYYPVADVPDFEDTRTRSEAWDLGHGDVVVKVEARSGCVAVNHLEPRQTTASVHVTDKE